MKKCNKCHIEKSFDQFNKNKKSKDGFSYNCKKCKSEYDLENNKTLDRCLQILVNSGNSSSKTRKNRGRIESGCFNITLSYLKKLWENQKGKCYYSNIPMNFDKREWKISLERINTDKGYIKDNVVLCCLEFNGRSQWSKEKIKEMISILEKNIKNNYINFELKKKKYKKREKINKIIIDDIEYYICTYCNKNKLLEMFTKNINNGCKECISIRNKERISTPRGSLNLLISHAKNSTKNRIKINNSKRDNSFDIDFTYLVELYNEQKGLCAYSGLPLQFGNYLEKNWTCSLERIDVLKGYIKNNVCLICLEFNTIDNTIRYKEINEGISGWNKEKFNIFLSYLKEYIE